MAQLIVIVATGPGALRPQVRAALEAAAVIPKLYAADDPARR